jgi:hypothetical protein
LFLLAVNESFFLFQARTSHAGDHTEQSHQEETEQEKNQKHFRLAIHEKEETQSENDYDNHVVLSKGNNAVHEFENIHKASLLKPLHHSAGIRGTVDKAKQNHFLPIIDLDRRVFPQLEVLSSDYLERLSTYLKIPPILSFMKSWVFEKTSNHIGALV